MSIVIDASVALKWVLTEAGSDAALELLSGELIAPSLWLAEAANALWRHVRGGQISAIEAGEFLSGLHAAPVATKTMNPYLSRALTLASELDHPVYDCIYLALALDDDTYVVTADRRFAATARRAKMANRVRLLGT